MILNEFLCLLLACTFRGQEYSVGREIQPDCGTRCICELNEANPELNCNPVQCDFDGPTCHINGDPHYRTFDLKWHHFQGTCEYTLTKPRNNNDFSVSARNAGHDGRVSCVAEVTVSVPGENFIAVLGRGRTITVNGAVHPNNGDEIIYENNDKTIQVTRTGGFPYVLLNGHGVKVFYDGVYRVDVTVSLRLQGQLVGLCGTNNANQGDDYTTPDGTILTDVNAFGDSWLVPSSTPGCTGVGKREAVRRNAPGVPGCTNDTAVIQEGQTRCSVLAQGAFLACNDLVDPATFIENCEFDYCCTDGEEREVGYCDNLEAYAGVCAIAGLPPPNWRQEFCRKLNLLYLIYMLA